MADVKISGLPSSTVPLAGTEVLPIVQGATTKQVSVANLTAGRPISATVITANTVNLGSATNAALGAGNSSLIKNRIINGAFYVAQKNTSATLTAGGTIADGYATVDRFYGYCTGANVTMAQVAGTGSNRNLLRFTGAASVTAIGCGQRIEAVNSYDLAGQTVTLSAFLANSVLTSVTWTAYYANTTDSFGTLGSPTRTQIATGTFTVTATLTQYSTQIAIPAAATTGVEIVFTVGAQTSGTWDLGLIQLELGNQVTGFEYRQYQQELALCQRYYYKTYDNAVVPGSNVSATLRGLVFTGTIDSGGSQYTWVSSSFPVYMRSQPTINYWDVVGNATKYSQYNGATNARTDNVGAWGSVLASNAVLSVNQAIGANTAAAFAFTATSEL
jgi:hypothetical protein